ncbi:MAG: putative bifunctional diguanylate cyclase/phosphodiesterase [Gaiellaceae bacterium]
MPIKQFVSLARPDRAFFLIATACALAYVSLPRDTAYYDRWYQLFPIAAVGATLLGVAVNQPRSRMPWYFVAISGLCGVAADALYAVELERVGEVPFPSEADFLALGSYVVLAAALLVMIRMQAPGRDWPSLIDAGIVTVGVAIVGWMFLVQPRLMEESSALETAVALAFPILDVLLVSLAARMVLGPGLRSPAFAMVTTALVFQLVGDALYGFGSLHGWYRVGDPIDLLFVLAAVLWGTAALHPSMVELTEPNLDPEQRLSGRRLAVLSAATLMAPAMLAVAALRAGNSELLVIVGAGATLSALVIVRLAGLVARHERSEQREHSLGTAAAALVAAWTPDDIYRVAVDSALAVAASVDATVGLTLGAEDDFRVMSAAGPRAERMLRFHAGELSDEAVTMLAAARQSNGPRTLRLATKKAEWTMVRLSVQGDSPGALVFHTRDPLSKRAREGVETLAAQVALALEGVTLAEELHERQSAERFRSLVQNSSDIIALLSSDLTVRYHTPSVERVLGYGEDELVGSRLVELLDSADGERLRGFFADVCDRPGTALPRDLPLRRKDGTICQVESVFNNLLDDPNVAGVVVTARDVTERRALEDQLAHQAFHDSLTGLANRALFSDRVQHALGRGIRRKNLFAVLFIDLDDFKTVNDSLGHAAGDELLVAVARRIESCLRPEDTCARLGGDEFAVLIESISEPGSAVAVARRILGAMTEPLTILGSELAVQGSVGITLGTGEQTTSEIMRSADLAMYRAKTEGKGRHALYEASLHESVRKRLALKTDLQRAVGTDELDVYYQPIVALASDAIVGVEALLHWHHPERGLVPTSEFIGLAEETGLIHPMGRLVLRKACAQVAHWRSLGHSDLRMSVDISAGQLSSRHLSSDVAAALAESSLDPAALTIEISESTLLDDTVATGRFEELKALGLRIAIDDFGAVFSSLDLLRRFPVDTIKIARVFADDIGSSVEKSRLVAAILRLGATLGFETVAVGIDSESQRERLRALGCRYGQGYLFSHPVPAHELEATLERAQVA